MNVSSELLKIAKELMAGRTSRSINVDKAISIVKSKHLVVTSASPRNPFNTKRAISKIMKAMPHNVEANLFDDGSVTFQFGGGYDSDFIEFTKE